MFCGGEGKVSGTKATGAGGLSTAREALWTEAGALGAFGDEQFVRVAWLGGV